MKILSTCLLCLLAASSAFAASALQHEVSAAVRAHEFSLKKGVILEGYDVVSYQQGGPQQGSQAHQVEYKGVVYYFVNDANRSVFLAKPERYEPLYGGWCAYAMLEGEKTKVNPESYKVVGDRLLLFYDGIWGDTKKLWNEMLEVESKLIDQADAAWEKHLD